MPPETRKMLALDADESAPKCRENADILSHTKWIYFGGGEEKSRPAGENAQGRGGEGQVLRNSRAERLELLKASRLADGAVVKPVETAVKFGPDRSAPRPQAFISPDGDLVANKDASVARDVRSLEGQQPAKRSGTKGPTLVDCFCAL